MRWPFSNLPAPTAITSPSWGFSFAVSGMMIPPLAVSVCSRRRTSTRSCSGVILTVIFLVSIPSVPNSRHLIVGNYQPRLRAKGFLILLPFGFEVVHFFFLEVGVPLRFLLLLEGHRVRDDNFRLRVQ